jgi:SAM-dependent MidA family methyltransferase
MGPPPQSGGLYDPQLAYYAQQATTQLMADQGINMTSPQAQQLVAEQVAAQQDAIGAQVGEKKPIPAAPLALGAGALLAFLLL